MVKLNTHFDKLSPSYLHPQIRKHVSTFRQHHPTSTLLELGMGDVTKPLSPFLHAALLRAVQELGDQKSFRGYGPAQGYCFLRDAIALGDYPTLGISSDEIFIADGAKSTFGNLQDLFSEENRICLCDPSYPVYLETALLAGWTNILSIPCLENHGFIPYPPEAPADLIYLASPNNPTGIPLDRQTLFQWVEYAHRHQAIIIYDGSYQAFLSSDAFPRSIYEIEGAKEVAIEIRSFSKTAGFTGLRCSYTVVPKELETEGRSLHKLWQRRTDVKFGGVPYPIQRCAAAIYTPEGKKEVERSISSYRERAFFFLQGLKKLGYTVYGGEHSPYLFCKNPPNLTSWQFFDFLLERAHLVSIPGPGFGAHGEGFVRFSAFAPLSSLTEALLRLKNL